MRIERLHLHNFKCYDEAELSLDRGVTVVHGVNGSGKSTLLEAVFFTLYGAKSLDEQTLDDVITTGAEAATIELEFTHNGRAYRIERQLKRRGDRATTTKCVFETPSGSIEGARDVRREITSLLRMDAESFVNCAYVRQGEVNKLIHASPSARQDMIDDLLQLGVLETYRERASDARLGVKSVLDGRRDVLESLREQVAEKEEKDLHERLNDLESKKRSVEQQVDRFESQRAEAERTYEASVDVLERHEETRTEIETLESEIDELESEISKTEVERRELREAIRSREEDRKKTVDRRRELLESVPSDIESLGLSTTEDSESIDLADGDVSRGEDGEQLGATANRSVGEAGLPGGDDDPLAEIDVDADEETITETVESCVERLEAADETLRDRLETLRTAITETSAEIDGLTERAENLEELAAEDEQTVDDIESALEEATSVLEKREERLSALADRIDELRETFDDAPCNFGEAESYQATLDEERASTVDEMSAVNAKIEATTEAIAEAEALLEAGKCPKCGQPVEDSPHVDVLDERRETLSTLETERDELTADLESIDERLEEASELCETEREVERLERERETVTQLLSEKKATQVDRRERIEALEQRVEERRAEAKANREKQTTLAETIQDLRADLGAVNADRGTIKSVLGDLHDVLGLTDEIRSLEAEVESHRNRRSGKAELNEERRTRLAEKRTRIRDLQDAFDEAKIEAARENREKAETYLEQVKEKLAALDEERESLANAIGAVRNELEELTALRDRLESVEDTCARLESVYEEAETLQTTYGDLRADLRQKNVDTLERLLNETFDLVYQNDSYAGIELDGEYRLTVYQKDGEPLEPEQLSGGERALFNLSLRCAIYRLLAEGVEGNAPLPPLILDEPTVFLDAGHVTQLVALVESMRRLGVEQIVVVSHDDELVGAADSLVRVTKDATSNRSQLATDETIEPALLRSD